MTTPLEAENAILSRWVTLGGALAPFVFQEERQPSTISTGETAWIKVCVEDVPSEQQTLAPVLLRKFLRRAAVLITVYTPSGRGVAEALALAQSGRAVFEGTSFDGLSFYTGSLERLGPVPPEYLVLVTVPFDYRETK